jgi:hypothetical protein
MFSARRRTQSIPLVARRGFAILLAIMALTATAATPALAKPPHSPSGQPEHDTYIPTRTPAEAAIERRKMAIAAAIRGMSPGYTAFQVRDVGVMSPTACETSCDYDWGGSGGGGSGSTGGGTGVIPPSNRVVLEVRARHQSTTYWCGPASGQVVINYSRGYVYDSLNGDSTATNWKTQDTIAAWMKTNENSGTLGSNLAAALNRPDAVLKPIPEWSYVYSTNVDGSDMHSKLVTDVAQFEMPILIAVKPHKPDAAYWLPSWPREAGNAKHWIAIYGYDGLWDGTDGPTVFYTESAGNGNKNPGSYQVGSLTMWKVNQYNASTIVW